MRLAITMMSAAVCLVRAGDARRFSSKAFAFRREDLQSKVRNDAVFHHVLSPHTRVPEMRRPSRQRASQAWPDVARPDERLFRALVRSSRGLLSQAILDKCRRDLSQRAAAKSRGDNYPGRITSNNDGITMPTLHKIRAEDTSGRQDTLDFTGTDPQSRGPIFGAAD